MPAAREVRRIRSIGGRVAAGASTVVLMSGPPPVQRGALVEGGGWSGVDLRDGEQWQAQVAHLAQNPVQCRLVERRTGEHGAAVVGVGEGHPVEPGGPSGLEVAPEANLVAARVG